MMKLLLKIRIVKLTGLLKKLTSLFQKMVHFILINNHKALDLLHKMLEKDPKKRITIE